MEFHKDEAAFRHRRKGIAKLQREHRRHAAESKPAATERGPAQHRDVNTGQMRFFKSKETALAWGAAAAAMVSSAAHTP